MKQAFTFVFAGAASILAGTAALLSQLGCNAGCREGDSFCEGNQPRVCTTPGRGLGLTWLGHQTHCDEYGATCVEATEALQAGCSFPDVPCPPDRAGICVGNVVARCVGAGMAARAELNCAANVSEQVACVEDATPPREDAPLEAFCSATDRACDVEGATQCDGDQGFLVCERGFFSRRRECTGSTCIDAEGGALCVVDPQPCEDGERRCAGDVIATCVAGHFRDADKSLCWASEGARKIAQGTCVEGPTGDPMCAWATGPCENGDSQCAGVYRIACVDGFWSEWEACPSGEVCEVTSSTTSTCTIVTGS